MAQVRFAFNPSYSAFYSPPAIPDLFRIDGSLKIELGPKTVGQVRACMQLCT